MADPVTLALAGGAIGAAIDKEDPLKGALLGAVGGYAGGSLLPEGFSPGIGNVINGVGTNAVAGGNVAQGMAINASLLAGSPNGAAALAASAPTAAGAAETAATTSASLAPEAAQTFAYGSQSVSPYAAAPSPTGFGSGFSSIGEPNVVAANPFSSNPAFASTISPAELPPPSLWDKALAAGKSGLQFAKDNPGITAVAGNTIVGKMMEKDPPPQILQGQIQRGKIESPGFAGLLGNKRQERRPISLL